MGKYIDAALAANAAAKQAAADAEAAARQALIDDAVASAAPLWAGADDKPIIDPLKATRAEDVDEGRHLVILAVLDDKGIPEVHFAVYPDRDEARVVTKVDGKWTGLESPPVRDLDDVGAVLAGDI